MAEREHVVNIVGKYNISCNLQKSTYNFTLIDSKTGSVSSQTVRVQDHDVVGKLEDLLPDFELPFFIKNGVREINHEEIFEEAFDEGDVVSVFLGANDDEPERAISKEVQFDDCSNTNPKVIVMTLGSKTPEFFDKTNMKSLKFNKITNWSNEVEIWR